MGASANSRPTSRNASELSRQASASAFGPISAIEAHPASPIVRSNSPRMSGITCARPPRRPARAPRRTAGRADRRGAERQRGEDVGTAADAAVEQYRHPARDRAATIPGSASSAAIARSTCRPPWLETTCRRAPVDRATASSGCSTPLSRIGSRVFAQPGEVGPVDRRAASSGDERLDRGARQRRAQVAQRPARLGRASAARTARSAGQVGASGGRRGRPPSISAGEDRVARVLRDPSPARERQPAEVEVADAPARAGSCRPSARSPRSRTAPPGATKLAITSSEVFQ